MLGIFSAVLLCGQVAQATEPGIIGNLTETSVKISSIDMAKNPTEAARIFSTLYSGSKAAGKTQSDTVYSDSKPGNRPSEKDIKRLCNAEPKKIGRLGKKVPAPTATTGDIPDEKRPYFWHGPNPNPSNDPAIQEGLENGVNAYCTNHPNAPACDPNNPHSPLHDPNAEPETGSQTYGANYYWHNRQKEITGIGPDSNTGNGK